MENAFCACAFEPGKINPRTNPRVNKNAEHNFI
jgi:hypothetical protein